MLRRLGVALATLALALAIAAAPAAAAGKRHAHVVKPGDSIQAAVDAARPGATIHVKRGVYRENVVITKDGITLRGHGAVLRPPAGVGPACSFGLPAGICVLGELDDEGNVTDYVRKVTVVGFTVRGFDGNGIAAVGAQGATFAHNHAIDNTEYGLAASSSTGTRMLHNRVHGSEDAGLYVGDSPQARATLLGNHVFDNQLGIFVRNALGGKIVGNRATRNCLGALVLGGAPGPAGEFRVHHNLIARNTRACPAGEENPPISGIGVALLGATGVVVRHNAIVGNVPSGPTAFQGGVVVASFGDPTAPAVPTNNRVRRNLIVRNDPDLFWDGTGTGNVLQPNACNTSQPPDLCD